MELTKKRLYIIDEIRGIAIICVVIYHFLFDVHVLFGIFNVPWLFSDAMQFVRVSIVIILMIISGISCHLSKGNIKRAVKILTLGMCISLLTFIIYRDSFILFGIFHYFGCAILLYELFKNIILKLPQKTFIIIFMLCFYVTYNIHNDYINLFFTQIKFNSPNNILLVPLGISLDSFPSLDYYPILPWIFPFLTGTLLGRSVTNPDLPKFLYKEHIPILSRIGRKTLLIYIIHQPILFAIFYGMELL
ncbi:hypothetical protein AN639_09905 [Candidatus Epulonipiscium fishelsonii]|uniref:Uncharacterized protein n=1 Tax=Candidatus Epulonipiscium fishelsonii TaxID=77094 RepID=A0ACC8XG11_9FIRM|nr:hypothetical protein AN396_01650 [Epulopiscium sp. SCG-B11WGA-EpuloA1]ONI43819.1 hypothetical protein AN639_09905 [Epulopiscium sp. SCG-B05WGA-EpuloA1]